MAIRKQKLANQANAKKSTGPVSEAGKERVSRNSRKHGLCGSFFVLECENQAEYEDLFERFMRAEQSADDVERELVAKMARHTWMSERAIRLQEACFHIFPAREEDESNGTRQMGVQTDMDVYIRYQTAHDRAYARAAAELAKRRKERRQAEIGFASQKRQEEKHQLHMQRAEIAIKRAQQPVLPPKTAAASVSAEPVTTEIPPEAPQIAA